MCQTNVWMLPWQRRSHIIGRAWEGRKGCFRDILIHQKEHFLVHFGENLVHDKDVIVATKRKKAFRSTSGTFWPILRSIVTQSEEHSCPLFPYFYAFRSQLFEVTPVMSILTGWCAKELTFLRLFSHNLESLSWTLRIFYSPLVKVNQNVTFWGYWSNLVTFWCTIG